MDTTDTSQLARDMDLVRAILVWAEKGGVPSARPCDLTVALCYHVKIMAEAGLILGQGIFDRIPGTQEFKPGLAHVSELTWKGQEFLEACRNDTIWAAVKVEAKKRALPLLFDLCGSIARGLAIKQGAPLA